MTDPVQRINVVAETLASLLTQFQGLPVITEYIKSFAIQLQELENVFFKLLLLRSLDTATGAQLDGLGLIVGEPRQGRDDVNYRAAISSRILINRSSATVNQILAILVSIQDRPYILNELGYAAIEIYAGNEYLVTDPTVASVLAILKKAVSAGVSVNYIYQLTDDANVFTTASGDAVESSTTQGTANDTFTTGGFLADVVE
jgi:hypothetical protein